MELEPNHVEPRKLTLSQTRDVISQKNGDRRTIFWSKGKPGAYSTAAKYLGQWKDNEKHGKGTQTWANGDKYVGEWAAGKPSGFGTYWKQSKKEGLLKQYAGQWANGQQNGRGVFYYEDGGMYDGQWRNGLRHGVGTMSYADGSVYEGDWFNDKRHGFGIYDHANGDHFEGHYVEDKREGEGVHFFFSAEKKTHHKRMDGEWVADICKCSIYSEMEPDPNVPASEAPEPLPKLQLLAPDSVLAGELRRIREHRAHHRATRVTIDEHFTPEVRERTCCPGRGAGRRSTFEPAAKQPLRVSSYQALAGAQIDPPACTLADQLAIPSAHSCLALPYPVWQELVALRTAFARVDVAGQGVLTLSQLHEAFAHIGMDPTDDELENVLGNFGVAASEDALFAFADFAQACDLLSPVE